MHKLTFLFLFLLVSTAACLQSQIQQNINTSSGTTSNAIAAIDSIRFNATSGEMQIVLNGGMIEEFLLDEISNVTFAPFGTSEHACGAANVHNPALAYGNLTDQEGNVYKTIVIGSQEWMAENLKTSVYRNGDAIPNVTNGNDWSFLSTGAWAVYNNDSNYNCPHGKLYNWYAVADSRKVCPVGWHMPSDAEWNVLAKYIDPAADTSCYNCVQSAIAGGKMKTPGLDYWQSPNTEANNASGFSALGSGFIDSGQSLVLGYGHQFWTSTELDSDYSYYRSLGFNNGNIARDGWIKTLGFSVRCLKD